MKKLVYIIVLLIWAGGCFADGKFFSPGNVPPDVPFQRALIAFDGEREILVVQSKYSASSEQDLQALGWVVPVPAVPDVGTLNSDSSAYFFDQLYQTTLPKIINIPLIIVEVLTALVVIRLFLLLIAQVKDYQGTWRRWLGTVLGNLVLLLSQPIIFMLATIFGMVGESLGLIPLLATILILITALVAVRLFLLLFAKATNMQASMQRGLGTVTGNLRLLVPLMILTLLNYFIFGLPFKSAVGAPRAAPASAGIQLLQEKTVGSYEVKVIKADTGGELVEWLNRNGFRFNAADEKVFADYIGKHWVFVTAKISQEAENKQVLASEGMMNPLVLRFQTKQAVYPLALTANGGRETEIELYVLHTHKMEAGGRLPLQFANALSTASLFSPTSSGRSGWEHYVEPGCLLSRERFTENYISKFRGRLSAEQMKTDLVLTRAADDNPHGVQRLVWSEPAHLGPLGYPAPEASDRGCLPR